MHLHGGALAARQIELSACHKRVGGPEVAIHDGDVGGEVAQIGAVGAVQEMVEASTVVVVAGDEEAGLLIGSSAERGAAAVADARGPVPVA